MRSSYLIFLLLLGMSLSCGDQSSKQTDQSTVSDVVQPPNSFRYQCRNQAGTLCKQEIIIKALSKDSWGKNSCKVYRDLASCIYDCQVEVFGKDRGNRCVQMPTKVPVFKKKPAID